jgi:ubiquinone/menaquinone biosynthesis C-methylase UbiE
MFSPREELVTDRDWQDLARMDPFWAVASWPDKRNSWTAKEFYALGESDAADALLHWDKYEPGVGGVCVEVGSGAGRMTRPLARRFQRVIGLDVSEDMIRLAREAVPDAEFLLVSGTRIPLEEGSADAVFTTHVLHHLEGIENVTAYFAEMFRVLRPGGTIAAQMILGPVRPTWRRIAASVRMRLVRARLRRGYDVRHFHGERYPAPTIRGRLHTIGFCDVELWEFEMHSNGDAHSFWFARKP